MSDTTCAHPPRLSGRGGVRRSFFATRLDAPKVKDEPRKDPYRTGDGSHTRDAYGEAGTIRIQSGERGIHMRRAVAISVLIGAIVVPSAFAADPTPGDFKNAAKYCKAARSAQG